MNNPPDRPRRSRSILTTMEVCVNRGAGPFGSVEVIESLPVEPYTNHHLWPLGEHGMLTASQLSDINGLVGKILAAAIYTRVHVQSEIPGLLPT